MAFNPGHYKPPQAKNTPLVQQWNQPQRVGTGYVEPFQPGCTTKPHPSRPDYVKSNQPVYNQYDAFQSGYVQSFTPSPGCVQPTHASEDTALSIGPGRKHLHMQNTQRGKISELFLNEGYGFLSSTRIKDEAQSQSIYFKFNNDSNTEIGLLDLQVGDILEFNLNSSSERQWATHARLLKCSQRSPEALTIYMNKLLQENPGKVLREVTKTPAGLILVLETKRQSFNLISLVLKLANLVSTHEAASLYKARLKQFYKLFSGTAFLRDPGGLHGYISEICNCDKEDEEENGRLLFKQFCFQLTEYCKDLIADLLAVLRVIVKSTKEDNAPSTSRFLLEMFSVLTGGAVDYSQEFYWTRVPLHPLDSEINGTIEMDKSRKMSSLKLIPCVIKKGSYGSTEVYLDTYFRLLTEDCFTKLKSGISALKSYQLDPRDMRVWIEGSVLGIHFGTGYSGISIAIKTEKRGRKVHSRSDMPMTGNLLCISDDGGSFESPIWGIVTGCEEENNKAIIFTEILDEGDEVGVQSISRLLGASNIVLAESPTYYKAYQPVLKSLQQMDLEKLPFKDELVDANWPNKAPDYLNSSTTLNWSCLFDDKSLRRNFFELDDSYDSNLGSDIIASKYITAQKNTIFGVHGYDTGCKTSLRSNISELNSLLSSGYKPILDESQLGAVNLALNNRLVLIQGPPGTGKTYVGVRILELLLTADSLPSGPVMVITYKNHSLDQFLISCLRFCGDRKTEDLVRLGGRSTDPLLDKYNMSIHLNEGNIFNSDCKHNKSKLNVIRSEMENLSQELKESNVFHMKAILHRMPDKQLRQLPNTRYNINLVCQVPVEVPIMDYIENQKGESRRLLTQIYQALSQSLMWWMPSRETFELVKEILSMEKQPQNFEMAYDINIDGENTVENLEDIEDENEEKAELGICMAETRGGRKEWLEENFLRFTTDDNSNPFGGIKRLNNVDLKEYGWVMHENPWHLKASHRAIMIYLILQLNHEEVLRRFGDAKKQYDELVEDMKEITKRRQLDVLMNAKIVGMTTTGAAMHQDILKMLAPPIIMVEEAAEVLEPQLLAAIGPSLQHLILIGDHYQLPPPVESYKLKLQHGLGVSMFERLIEHNKLPHQTLSVQSRMHEELLPLILPIYPDLKSNVKLVSGERNKEPKCMMRRMHFWCHAYKENRERSFQNEWEAKMVIALAQWMVAEGHAPTEIAILAAYNGQVMDRTERFIQPSHGICPIVTKIEKVSNLEMEIKFLESQKHLFNPNGPRQLLFHGTNDAAIKSIISKGFKLPPKGNDNMFGRGCYFATDSTKSAQKMYTKGSNKLLLCEVNLGNTWTVQEPCKDMDLDKIKGKEYDSLFSKRKGNATGGTLYDEFVIYDVRQAIVRYIVHYRTIGLDSGSLNSQTLQFQQQNLVRIPYELSTSFTGYNDSECHFRLAESQFFRMSKRSEYKVVKVELILNIALTKSYEKAKQKFIEAKKPVEEMLVFHGTDKNAIEKIVEEGFKIGGDGIPVRNGCAYGSGVYTASDPSISIPYAKGLNMLLLSLALIGKEGSDYKTGGSQNIFVLDKTEYLLPKYIVHFEMK